MNDWICRQVYALMTGRSDVYVCASYSGVCTGRLSCFNMSYQNIIPYCNSKHPPKEMPHTC